MTLTSRFLNAGLRPLGLEVAPHGALARAEGDRAKLAHECDALAKQVQMEREARKESERIRVSPALDLAGAILAAEQLADEERSEAILALLTQANNRSHLVHPLFSKKGWQELAGKALYHATLGAAEFGRGNFTVSEAYFERALRGSAEPAYFHAAARCASVLGDEARSAAILRQGMAIAPHEKRLAVELAGTEFRMGNVDVAQQLLDASAGVFDSMRAQADGLAEELRRAVDTNAIERVYGGDLYDDAFVDQLWWSYHESFSTRSAWQDGTVFIGHLVRERVAELQREVNAPAVIDFGVMTAFPNLQLARMFPKAVHFGVDRQSSIKTMNERFYSADNLSFVDGDILDFVRRAPSGSILVHARTGTVCYPAFLRALYEECAGHGIGYIVVIEFAGASKHTLQFHDFAGAGSVASRSNMFFHPYRNMLSDAGYEVRQELRFNKQYGIGTDFGLGEAAICLTAGLRR